MGDTKILTVIGAGGGGVGTAIGRSVAAIASTTGTS